MAGQNHALSGLMDCWICGFLKSVFFFESVNFGKAARPICILLFLGGGSDILRFTQGCIGIRGAWERGACRASYGLQGPKPYISTARRAGAVSRTDTGQKPTYVIFGTGSDMPRSAYTVQRLWPVGEYHLR